MRCVAGSKVCDVTAGEYDDEVRGIEFGMDVK